LLKYEEELFGKRVTTKEDLDSIWRFITSTDDDDE